MNLNFSCLLWLAALSLGASAARAVDALVIEAQEVRSVGIVARGVSLRLTPTAAGTLRPEVTTEIKVAQLDLGGTLGSISRLQLLCRDPRLAEPRFGCEHAAISGLSTLAGPLTMQSTLQWRSDTGVLQFSSAGQPFAGGLLDLQAHSDARGWQLSAASRNATVAGLRSFGARWFALPASIETSGAAQFNVSASGVSAADAASVTLQLSKANFGNEDATIAGENLAATLQLNLRRAGAGYDLTTQLDGDAGQALAGPVLLDLQANPLHAQARGRWLGDTITLDALQLTQRNLSRVSGKAVLRPAGSPYLRSANIEVEDLSFPAAYSSFLQIALAAGDFGALNTTGHVRASVALADDAISSIDGTLDGIDVGEQKRRFAMQQLRGELHWRPRGGAAPAASWLAWQSGNAYGLSGGATRLDFTAQGLGFELVKPARVPVFDGALRIDALSAQQLTTAATTLRFAGEIEPISMPLLSKAFGWPELSGKLSGRIPRVEYRDKLLTFSGDVEARVFNGLITGSNIRLKDPLGPWPRLFADVRARDLDLALVTNTFSIGSITGRLEADILGLELFDWSPVAFDAALRTPPGDRGRHRISAKAVGDLSNIGGGGGGVVKALQSGAFKMFDEYDYARLGLRCKLENEVCLMSGIETAGIGYYILQGKGLPHIDIIGNAGRVNWRQLASQIGTQMRGEGKIRVD